MRSTIRGKYSGVKLEVLTNPIFETNILRMPTPVGSCGDLSALVGKEHVKLEITPVRLTQGTPKIVILRSLS